MSDTWEKRGKRESARKHYGRTEGAKTKNNAKYIVRRGRKQVGRSQQTPTVRNGRNGEMKLLEVAAVR